MVKGAEAPILFVTGTDTGVGKTTIACGLCAELTGAGWKIDVCKPVETGCRRDGQGELIADDGLKLSRAAGLNVEIEKIVPYRFALPAAPTVAAAADGASLNLKPLIEDLKKRSRECELLIVEGAGGLLVPLTAEASFADFAAEIEAKVLLVVGSKLGAINHSALTCEVLRSRCIEIAGYVLNECYPRQAAEQPALETNRQEIKRVLACYRAEELGYFEHFPAKNSEPLSLDQTVLKELSSRLVQRLDLGSPAICCR